MNGISAHLLRPARTRARQEPGNANLLIGVSVAGTLTHPNTIEIQMTVPLYSYEQEFQGYIPERYALKLEANGVAQLVRQKGASTRAISAALRCIAARLPVCLPRDICRCDCAIDCVVVLSVNLLKHVAGGARQGNTRDRYRWNASGRVSSSKRSSTFLQSAKTFRAMSPISRLPRLTTEY
jgi:hypothetical protein